MSKPLSRAGLMHELASLLDHAAEGRDGAWWEDARQEERLCTRDWNDLVDMSANIYGHFNFLRNALERRGGEAAQPSCKLN
jgi:hypothetical protein